MSYDREATRQALMQSAKVGQVSGIMVSVETMKVLAKLGKDLRASDVNMAIRSLTAMADKMNAEINADLKK
jgi:hypothetical protein